jgi:LPS-assembly lipoprotein
VPNTPTYRLSVQIRNDLIYGFNGGGDPPVPAFRLKVAISGAPSVLMTDSHTRLPSAENYALTASYSLTEVATGKVVVTGRVATNVSYDTLGQARFARISGMKDAELRAAKVVSDNITTRLASYFVSGG